MRMTWSVALNSSQWVSGEGLELEVVRLAEGLSHSHVIRTGIEDCGSSYLCLGSDIS